MAIDGRLCDAAQFGRFQQLLADSVIYPKGDRLYVDYRRLRQAMTQGLAFDDLNGESDWELYDALNRLRVTITVEAVCLRRSPDTGGVEVLLTRQPDDQPHHPERWRCP